MGRPNENGWEICAGNRGETGTLVRREAERARELLTNLELAAKFESIALPIVLFLGAVIGYIVIVTFQGCVKKETAIQ